MLDYPTGEAQIGEERHTISEGDVNRLREDAYLNDSLVDFYLKMLMIDALECVRCKTNICMLA